MFTRDDEQDAIMKVIAPKGSMENRFHPGRLSEDPYKFKVIAIAAHQLMPMAGMEALEKDEEEGNEALLTHAAEMYEMLKELIGSYTRDDYWKQLKKAKELVDSIENYK